MWPPFTSGKSLKVVSQILLFIALVSISNELLCQDLEPRRWSHLPTGLNLVGASLAVTMPLGKYCDDCLINVGSNRWSVRPQIGVVHTRGPWKFELTGSVFVFTDNDDFVDDAILKQKSVYTAQAHVIYTFKPGAWASLSTGYGTGGRISVDQLKTSFEVDNWIWSANFGYPIGKAQSVMLTWLSGRTQNQVGRDSDNLLLGWSIRWGN